MSNEELKAEELSGLWEKSAEGPSDPFWNEARGYFTHQASVLDQMLAPAQVAPAPQASKYAAVGDRVRFVPSLEALVAYKNPPPRGVEGSVVLVRLGAGQHGTEHQGQVFVKWDDGFFRPIYRRHLARVTEKNRRVADSFRMYFSEMGEVTPAFSMTGSDNELVHRSTKDLWSFREEQGGYVLERLFNSDGHPIKDN